MRITSLNIKNYRSFDTSGQTIIFTTQHSALVGKNNTGKSNIFRALNTHGGFGKWAWALSKHPSDLEEILVNNVTNMSRCPLFLTSDVSAFD